MGAIKPRVRQPYIITMGADTALTLSVFDELTQVEQTASAASVSVLVGSRALVSAASATSLGPPVSYTLTGATTSSESLSDAVLVRWSLTIGGTVYPFERTGYIVRQPFDMTITDDDLAQVDRNIASYRSPDDTTFGWAVEAARLRIERRLLAKGRRPHLIFDQWALFDCFVAETLAVIYGSSRTSVAENGMSSVLAQEQRNIADMEFNRAQFRYDEGETGTVDAPDLTEGGDPGVIISAGPAGGGRGGRILSSWANGYRR